MSITRLMREFAKQRSRGAATLHQRVQGQPQSSVRELGAGESRRHFRSADKVRWPVELQLVRPPARPHAARVRTEALGVSLGGTFVVSDDPLPIDTDLHLWLYPPWPLARPRVLRVLARVRWTSDGHTPGGLPRGFGVAFRALTAADEIALHSGSSRSAKVV